MKTFTLFLLLSLSQAVISQEVLKVKGVFHINYQTQGTKSPKYKQIILTPGSELIVSVSVEVDKKLWANSSDVKITFEGIGEILIKGQTNIKNAKIIHTHKKILLKSSPQLTGVKDMEYLQLWNLDGQMVMSDKFYKLKYKEIDCKRYDVRVKGRGFRSRYLIGRKK